MGPGSREAILQSESALSKEPAAAVFRPLVAFDFDGTLTWRDSFRAFLAWREGPLAYAIRMARLAREGVAYFKHKDRSRLKAAMVAEFLAGEARGQLEGEARRFAIHAAPKLLRPDALKCWRMWQERNARLIIVTATPHTIVAPFARGLGAETCIGSRLAFDPGGRVVGMDGPNCRGAEKVNRIRQAFGEAVRLKEAYGDSDGDHQMLELADEHGFKVFGGKP
jgi:phosphatidylglycerophosphatase C